MRGEKIIGIDLTFCKLLGRCGGCSPEPDFEEAWRHRIISAANEMGLSQPDIDSWMLPVLVSETRHSYRTRILLRGRVAEDSNLVWLGYFAEKTRDFVPIVDCPIADASIRTIVRSVSSHSAVRTGNLGMFRIELTSLLDNTVLVQILGGHSLSQEQMRHVAAQLTGVSGVKVKIVDVAADLRSSWVWDEHDGVEFLVRPGSFVQSHRSMNRLLRQKLVQWVLATGAKSVWDCFSGAGNFALALARKGIQVLAIESSPISIELLQIAAEKSNLNAFVRTKIGRIDFRALRNSENSPQLTIVDPPRAGLGDQSAAFAEFGTEYLIYVSCSTASFIQDWRALHPKYAIESLQAFEMYPHQNEFEILAKFRRRSD